MLNLGKDHPNDRILSEKGKMLPSGKSLIRVERVTQASWVTILVISLRPITKLCNDCKEAKQIGSIKSYNQRIDGWS